MRIIKRLVIVMLVVALLPVSVFAKSSLPYKDVSKKSVGKDACKAITYVYKHKGYVGMVKGKKFHPKRKITRGEFMIMLENFYGDDKVPDESAKSQKKIATPKWATSKMIEVADKGFGMTITWGDNSKKEMTRALASQYLRNFAKFDKAFKPRR